MATNFLWAAGNSQGYLSAAPLTGTLTTATSTALTAISPTITALKGMMVIAIGVPKPDYLAGGVSASATATLTTAATASASGVAYTILQNPILIGGEASALTNGQAVTSSYWNGNGVFRQGFELLESLFGSVWFMSGGAFTPTAGGALSGWWLPSIDGGTTFETAIATPSSTVAALPRAPDFIVSLDAAAHAAGNIRFSSGRLISPPPEASCKVIIQNNSGATLPSTWCVGLGPATPAA